MKHLSLTTISGVVLLAVLPVFANPPPPDRSIWYSYSKEQPLGERTLNYDLTKLMKLPPAEALKELDRFRGACTKAAPERPVHMPLLDAAVWTAYNPALPAYIEAKIKEYPITYESRRERARMFSVLSTLPAEWAARILIREALVKGQVVTSSKHDLTDDEVILELMLAQDDQMSPNPRLRSPRPPRHRHRLVVYAVTHTRQIARFHFLHVEPSPPICPRFNKR